MGIPSDPSYNSFKVGLPAMVQERPVRVERRLAAILAADVAGYSRLMHSDEEATHAKLTAFLVEAVHPAIAEHGGRIGSKASRWLLAAVSAVPLIADVEAVVRERSGQATRRSHEREPTG